MPNIRTGNADWPLSERYPSYQSPGLARDSVMTCRKRPERALLEEAHPRAGFGRRSEAPPVPRESGPGLVCHAIPWCL